MGWHLDVRIVPKLITLYTLKTTDTERCKFYNYETESVLLYLPKIHSRSEQKTRDTFL